MIRGALRRYTPPNRQLNWNTLHEGGGVLDFLVLEPTRKNGGTFRWTTNLEQARRSAELHYRESEGIDVQNGVLYFVSKRWKSLYILELDDFSYRNVTTRSGLMDGAPDQIQRVLGGAPASEEILYLFKAPRIHAWRKIHALETRKTW
ncbi:MAG: hypothetical protein AAGJ35_07890, partial [Myxococcota bacterium]